MLVKMLCNCVPNMLGVLLPFSGIDYPALYEGCPLRKQKSYTFVLSVSHLRAMIFSLSMELGKNNSISDWKAEISLPKLLLVL